MDGERELGGLGVDGSERDESELMDRGPLGGAPETPASGTDIVERCHDDRDSMAPKETALCAGVTLAERSENEEDGGS